MHPQFDRDPIMLSLQRTENIDILHEKSRAEMAARVTASNSSGPGHRLSELRIVLLGYTDSGKSSAGNTILNSEEFELKRAAQCVKRQRDVAGRHITVVEAPGWWRDVPVERSTELLKQETVLSVSLCPPGPHAVLLVIRVDSDFKENERKVLNGYLGLLSQGVWRHAIVLFTCGDWLGDRTIEQHIESEGKELQWLVEKCGSRYHVLNNENRSDDTQGTELLEKIEEMVAANSGCQFEIDQRIVLEVENKKQEEEKARKRMMKVQKKRGEIRSQMNDKYQLYETRIVLLGCRDAGKSSAGNTILNGEEFELKRAAQCVKRQSEVAGRHITVVEAPGWWSNVAVERSTELLKQEIVLSVSLCPPGPHAVLLIVRVDSIFEEKEIQALASHLNLFGKGVWSHTLVLFTHGDWLGDRTIEQHIESEGKELQWLVEKCGSRYHVLNNENRSDDTQVTELLEKIEEMVAANSVSHFELDRKILQEVEEKRRAEEERAKERMMKVQELRKCNRLQMGNPGRLSELRIVLLGYKGAGKTLVGNTVLNREDFKLKSTAQCVKRQRDVAGRHITVVEAPGWYMKESQISSEILKNIVFSLRFCNRGPHAVLLVICLDILFKEKQVKAIEGLFKHLGERAWNRTVVLFTHGDCLGDTPIEQHIESEGKELQWLVEKCGNRYHVLNNKNRSDDTQVTELLEKIEEMVAANSGRHFQLDRKILQEVEEKRRAEEERAKERMMKVEKQRKCNQLQMGSRKRLSELRIVLLGNRGAGKSSAGNTILNGEEFELKRAAQCVKRQSDVAGRHITVVEAPGWRFNESQLSSEVLKNIMFSLSVCIPGPHALLLVMCLKVGFKEKQLKTIKGYLKDLSERVWSHTIVLFTCGDCLGDTTIEQHIESEGKELQWLVEKCGNRYHVLNNKNRSDDTQVTELLEKIEEMVAANRRQKVQMEDERQIIEEGMPEGKVQDQREKELIRSDTEPQKIQLSGETWEKSVLGSALDTSVRRFDIDRAPSPAPSDISLKTDWSMDDHLNFSDNQRLKLESRPSSVLSYLSVETEYSAEHSFSLSETQLLEYQRFGLLRGSSPVPNEASMKTDSSMEELLNFSGSLPHQRSSIKPSAFGEMVQKFEEAVISPAAVSPSYAGPGDVPCDVCTGRNQRAVKTCVNCIRSFCETHVKPHYVEKALETHTLEEAAVALEPLL
ncbi:hypothetical protein AOLI_G00271180 [Acnodon oligacanthus]